MTTCDQHLTTLYRINVLRTNVRIQFIETWLTEVPTFIPLTEDESRNEPIIYQEIFSEKCRIELERCYRNAMSSIRDQSFGDSMDVLRALTFLQEIIATAKWKYDCETGPLLESFARRYDRLDDDSEQRRLHAEAQRSVF
jgi:hypothetical protein